MPEEEKYILITPEDMGIMLRTTVTRTLEDLGIKTRKIKPWISQNKAYQLVGRSRVDRAMREGKIKWRKENIDKKLGRIYLNRKDVEKLLNDLIS